MKKLNKKGFTLIELLAVIIILGVLLLIAVPAVSRYIQESREDTYATNLSQLVSTVSTEVNSYSSQYTFNTNEYLVVPFACIELERGNNDKSPFGNYEKEKSYVVVTRKADAAGFEYYVAALDNNGFGTALKNADAINGRESIEEIGDSEIGAITTADGTTSVTLVIPDGTAVEGISDKTAKVVSCDAFKTTGTTGN